MPAPRPPLLETQPALTSLCDPTSEAAPHSQCCGGRGKDRDTLLAAPVLLWGQLAATALPPWTSFPVEAPKESRKIADSASHCYSPRATFGSLTLPCSACSRCPTLKGPWVTGRRALLRCPLGALPRELVTMAGKAQRRLGRRCSGSFFRATRRDEVAFAGTWVCGEKGKQ